MGIVVREAGLADAAAVFAFVCELESGTADIERNAFDVVFRANMDSDSVAYLLAEDDERAVGFGGVHVQTLLHHCGPVAEVQELIVTKEYQGQGIGAMLLKQLEDRARRCGCRQIEVCCRMWRTGPNEFYDRCGFEKSHFKHIKEI